MTDDVEETLAGLEQRLQALQAELDEEEPGPPPTAAAPPSDALDRFGADLRRLVEAWERTVAEVRGGSADAIVFRGGVALEARGDLHGLCALDRALRDVPAVSAVRLRAYAGGAATLEVALGDDVALVRELRRSLAFEVVDARAGRLTIALG